MDSAPEAALQERWRVEVERINAGSSWVDESLQPVMAVATACTAANRGHYVVLSTWAVGDVAHLPDDRSIWIGGAE